MDWRTTYPSLATVMEASFETLSTWRDRLPAPQTDVERTVMRRLLQRQKELAEVQIRQQAPELADKINDLSARLAKLGIPSPFGKM